MAIKTIITESLAASDYQFNYQKVLTNKLDTFEGEFDQEVINQIVLWKVNRYAPVDDEALHLLNQISSEQTELNIALSSKVLSALLGCHGIRLPMASTILRFKNPDIYQIIDQRVYRMIYKNELKVPSKIDDQIELYHNYLLKLRKVCIQNNIDFKVADRVLYEADKRLNKDVKLNNYGSKSLNY
jgi:hypothetical protein